MNMPEDIMEFPHL